MAFLVFLASLLLVMAWFGWQRNTKNNSFYETIPCVGIRKDEWFAWTRAQLRSFSKTEEWVKGGYEKASNTLHKDTD